MALFINSNFIGNQYLGTLRTTLSSCQFWLTLFLTLVILLVPVMVIRFLSFDINPTLSDKCRLKQRLSRVRTRPAEQITRRRSSVRQSRRSLRSGYAFAHQEGFGRLITSGKLVQKPSIKSNPGSNNINSVRSSIDVPGIPVPNNWKASSFIKPLSATSDPRPTSPSPIQI